MINRKPTDKCLLCGINDATETGSHFVPEHLLRSSIGKRDYEAVGEINLETGEGKKIYGRSRLDNPSQEERHIPHVENYIFCPICEARLGKLETEIGGVISLKLFNPNQKENFREKNVGSIQYKECLRVNGNVFGLYIYSIVYRILLQQALGGYGDVFSLDIVDTIRQFIVDNVDKDLNSIKLEFPYKFTFIACPNRSSGEPSYVQPSLDDSNPALFYVGNFLILVDYPELPRVDKLDGLPLDILNSALVNGEVNYIPKITFLSKDQEEEIHNHLIETIERRK